MYKWLVVFGIITPIFLFYSNLERDFQRFSSLKLLIKGYMLAGADTNRIFIDPLMILSTLAVFHFSFAKDFMLRLIFTLVMVT